MVPRLDLLRAKAHTLPMKDDAMTETSTAAVPTTHASRYLQQLCKHWSHKFDVTFDATRGTIPFPSGAVATLEAGPEALVVRIEAGDAEALSRMQGVVADHLDRFAFREAPLPFVWG